MNNALARLVAWIREGYPAGVPDTDYVPLFALLRRRLSDEEVLEVAEGLVATGVLPVGRVDIGVDITKVLDDLPAPAEIDRVQARLVAVGWPTDPSALP